MCGCSSTKTQSTAKTQYDPAAMNLRVEDMTCGHCAATIEKAIESSIPGAKVSADPASKLVQVTGTTDLPAVKTLIAAAGYTVS